MFLQYSSALCRRNDKEVQECGKAAEAELIFTRAKLESLQKALRDGGSATQRLQVWTEMCI